MEKLDYEELEREVGDFITKNNKMILATCSNNRVTARMMSIVNQGMTIFFQTDKEYLKYQQIVENPNVALCTGNIQIEGTAKITCQPYENPFFIESYKRQHPSAFEKYSHLSDNVIIEVSPTLVTFWKYTPDRKPYRDFLDVRQKEAYREYYLKPDDVSCSILS